MCSLCWAELVICWAELVDEVQCLKLAASGECLRTLQASFQLPMVCHADCSLRLLLRHRPTPSCWLARPLPAEPRLLVAFRVQAARAGNVSAAVAAARYMESLPPPAREQAGWFWGKAARRGHPEAQAKLGLAYYKVSLLLGLCSDREERWLLREGEIVRLVCHGSE